MDFLHTKFSVLCCTVSIQLLRKRRKWKLEAVKFCRKRKRLDKISWKRKRTRKWPILSGDGSGSKKTKSEEAEANSEAWHFKRSRKRKQKIFYCFHISGINSFLNLLYTVLHLVILIHSTKEPIELFWIVNIYNTLLQTYVILLPCLTFST